MIKFDDEYKLYRLLKLRCRNHYPGALKYHQAARFIGLPLKRVRELDSMRFTGGMGPAFITRTAHGTFTWARRSILVPAHGPFAFLEGKSLKMTNRRKINGVIHRTVRQKLTWMTEP